MKLRVTNNGKMEDISLDTVVMPISEFCDIHSHPYIATTEFDYILVDLSTEIKAGVLRAVIGKHVIIPVMPEQIDSTIVGQLAELYPEYAAKLRFTFVRNKGDISDIVNELSEKFRWNKYYN